MQVVTTLCSLQHFSAASGKIADFPVIVAEKVYLLSKDASEHDLAEFLARLLS